MLRRFFHFVQYNNFFTLALMFLFLGSGVSLAASQTVRDGILSKTETTRSVDNSYIISVDLLNYNYGLKITNITENTDNYYVEYTYKTIDIVDYVWRDVAMQKSLTVSKQALAGKDLGLFIAKELGQIIDGQKSYLVSAQKIEKEKGKTEKVVATQYAGLIGSMLSTKEKVFSGYQPVVPIALNTEKNNVGVPEFVQPEGERSKSVPGQSNTQQSSATAQSQNQGLSQEEIRRMVEEIIANQNANQPVNTTPDPVVPTEPPEEPTNPNEDNIPPVITINGNNPANINVKDVYIDLGATVTDNTDTNPRLVTTGNTIDTSVVGTYTVTYVANDRFGNTSTSTRQVIVSDNSQPIIPPEPNPEPEQPKTDPVTETTPNLESVKETIPNPESANVVPANEPTPPAESVEPVS